MPYAVVGTGASFLSAPELGDTEGEKGGQNGAGSEKGWGPGQEGGVANGGVLSFVVVHDFFDTLEKTFLLFKPLVLKYPGCQVLCFNSPGQAGTRLPPEPEGLLTNVWVADRLDELMQVRIATADLLGTGRSGNEKGDQQERLHLRGMPLPKYLCQCSIE